MALDDLETYRSAAVATNFYQEGKETAAGGVLEKLVSTIDVGKDGPALVNMIRKSPEGNKLLAKTFSDIYQETLMGAKINEMFEFYSDDFKEFLDEDAYNEAKRIFTKYGNENYGRIMDDLSEAQAIYSGKKNRKITEKEKQEAESTIIKYQGIVKSLQGFEGLKMNKLSVPVEKESLKKDLAEMFKPQEAAA